MPSELDQMCWNKRRFPSEDAALEYGKSSWTAFALRAYECPNVPVDGKPHWHLTKKPGEGKWVQPDLSAVPRRVERARNPRRRRRR